MPSSPSTLENSSVFTRTALIYKSYELFKLTLDPIAKFPKPWRYTVGERLQNAILQVVEETGQALYVRQPLKENYILRVIGTLQTLTLLIRLCLDTKLIPEQKFFEWSNRSEELCRMAAGWLSATRDRH